MKFTCEEVARAGLGEPAQRKGPELLWRCPNHDDKHPSLSLNPQKNVWMCGPCGKSGTAWQLAAFIARVDAGDKGAVKAWLKDKGLLSGTKRKAKSDGRGPVVATFVHEDADGRPVCRKHRHEPGERGKEKSYSWERWENGKWVEGLGEPKLVPPLYRLPKIKNGKLVFLFESHTDVDRAVSMGMAATTSGGSGSWRDEYTEWLVGKDIVLVPDNDASGVRYTAIVCQSIHTAVNSLKVVSIAPHPDFRRWADAGGTAEKLREMTNGAPQWRPASGAEILDMLIAFITRFVSLTAHQSRVVALWVAHTWAFDATDATPYLSVTSAEKQSGKTRLLEVLRLLVFCAWFTGRVTAAVLARKIDAVRPTLLLDESDAAFNGEKEYAEALRGILNTGYRRGGTASCCVGQGVNIGFKDFSTFCPKAVAGIGKLPDTVADRTVPVRLKRARRGEVARFREREAQREGSEISARLAARLTPKLETLRQARPTIPAQLSDRQADGCEPLLAIADLAGGDWPEATRTALIELCGTAQVDDDSLGVRLLRDIKAIFAEKQVAEIASAKLCEALAEFETSPWGEWNHGKPITQAGLARRLKPFGIVPDRVSGGDARVRGYNVSQFEEAFFLYLPPESVHPSAIREISGDGEHFKASTKEAVDTSENAVSPGKNAACGRLDTLKAGEGEEEEEIDPEKAEVEYEA